MENKNDYIATERLYLDKDNNVVKANDPKKLTLLVAEGGRLPIEKATQYGLTNPEPALTAEDKTALSNIQSQSEADAEMAAEDDDDAASFDSLTVVELKEKAKEKGITGYSTMKRDELVAALEEAE